MNLQTVNATIDKLNQLLSPAAKVAWQAAVKQQYVIAVQEAIMGILLAAVGIVVVSKAQAWTRNVDNGLSDRDFLRGLLYTAGTSVTAGGLWLLLASAGHIVNPDAGAISWILGGGK